MSWSRDPAYFGLKAFLLEMTGLDYYSQKDDDLFARLQRRFAEVNVSDCATYHALLLGGGPELDELINELTIGETYFFRHQEQYDALKETVLPALLRRNATLRRLQVWSAGCSIGPEPYSLAILLEEAFPEVARSWAVNIVGTDINREALRKAREGTYEEWSLRSLGAAVRENYFEARGRKFHLPERIKRAVAFHYHNLVAEPFLPPPTLGAGLDLIICRNVTIYFDAPTCARLIRHFEDLLVPGGWLLVGHSEPNLEYFQRFEVVQSPGAILYRKPELTELAPIVRKAPPRLELLQPAAAPRPALTPTIPAAAPKARPEFSADVIQAHLNRGEYDDALRFCEERCRKDSLNPTWHYYTGKVLEELRRESDAEAAFRRCLYLNRDHVMTHLSLGALLKKKGRGPAARRHFETAARLLENLPETHVFPEAGQLSAGALKSLVRMHLEAA